VQIANNVEGARGAKTIKIQKKTYQNSSATWYNLCSRPLIHIV